MEFRTKSSLSDSKTYHFRQESQKSGWHQYQQALVHSGVKQQSWQWYARHVRRFLDYFTSTDIGQLSRKQVTDHFRTIPIDWFKHDWQQAQYIDAVRLLLVDVIRLPWASDFHWEDCISEARTLGVGHPTLARDATDFMQVKAGFSKQLAPDYHSALQALVHSLRENQYAIRTEQTYCYWVQRFLLFVGGNDLVVLTDQHVKNYLSSLVLQRNLSKSTQNIALNALVYKKQLSVQRF